MGGAYSKALLAAFAALAIMAALSCAMVAASQPGQAHAKLVNAYHPFTVELQVRDR